MNAYINICDIYAWCLEVSIQSCSESVDVAVRESVVEYEKPFLKVFAGYSLNP